MSDTSEDTVQSERQNDKEDNICRDFVRGLCDRKFCKYKHENDYKMLNFCHDYQNNVCPRPHCKFIHCTPEEVEEYKKTGEMSNQILAEATRKNQLPGTPPICNQFKKGLCRRTFCKYRHLTKDQEEAEILELVQNNTQRKVPQPMNNNISETQFAALLTGGLRRNGVSYDNYKDSGLPTAKRRFLSVEEQEILQNDRLETDPRNRIFKGYFAGNPPSAMINRIDASLRTILLEEENNMLHKEIAHLKRQVSDLTATNEFLLDQNANLRVSNKRNGTVNVPSVTITNANNAQPQPAQVNRTVIASVATVPVSLATVSTCNQVSGNHSVSIAGCPAVSIASPAQLLAPSQQILVTTNPSSQLAIANSSQAQLAIAQQNLANNLAQQQLTSQPQQLTLSGEQLALANTTQQLTSQAQQLAMANTTQQLTSQAQQLALANTTQQLAMANTTQQLTSQQLAVANVPQQLATLASTNQQLLAQQQQNLATEIHRNNQINAINTSQAIAMSNASQPMVSYPIMTQSINHGLTH